MAVRPFGGNYGSMGPDGQPPDTSAQSSALAADDASGGSVDPYSNPTNYRSFAQTYNANAGAAQDTAKRIAAKVSDEQGAAARANNKDYNAFKGQVQSGSMAGGTDYSGPDAYNPSGSTYEAFDTAARDTNNLGSTAGIQTEIGPGESMYSAALVQHAGTPQFQNVQAHGAKVAAELPQSQGQGADFVKVQKNLQLRQNERLQQQQQRTSAQSQYDQYTQQVLASNKAAQQAWDQQKLKDADAGGLVDPFGTQPDQSLVEPYDQWLAENGYPASASDNSQTGESAYIDPKHRGY